MFLRIYETQKIIYCKSEFSKRKFLRHCLPRGVKVTRWGDEKMGQGSSLGGS